MSKVDLVESMTDRVKQFTEESGYKCPEHPEVMNENEIKFITKMVISELAELWQTIRNPDEVMDEIKACVGTDFNHAYKRPESETAIIAEQHDAFVDIMYYMMNMSAKKGVNLDLIFDEVHNANMSKKFSDGEFHRREDGKIVKPDDWKEPDIVAVIEGQKKYGWNNRNIVLTDEEKEEGKTLDMGN